MDGEPGKRRLRWLRWVAVGFFALAIVFVILALLPGHSSAEPAWLANIPPTSFEARVYENMPYPTMATGGRQDIQVSESTRFVEMPFEAFVLKLKKDLRPEGGWHYSRPVQTLTASWNRTNKDGSGSATIWIIQEGPRIRVTSSDVHVLTWLDKVKRAVTRFFKR